MIKVGIADYGLNQWYGGMHDYEWRLKMLKEIGFDGIERLEVSSPAKALEYNALAAKMGMGFATCRGLNHSDTLTFSAGLAKNTYGCKHRQTILTSIAVKQTIKQNLPHNMVLRLAFTTTLASLLKIKTN